MQVRIYGPGCERCMEIESLVKDIVQQQGIKADIYMVTEPVEWEKMGIRATPALAINDQLKCEGRVPEGHEITTWVRAI